MRDYNKRVYLDVFWIVLGAFLFIMAGTGKIDRYWSGMGGGLIGVGIVQLIRFMRYKNNTEYKEKFDTEMSDERNRFIASKAWAWAGYCYVIGAGIGTIVFKIMGKDDLSQFCAISVCTLMILYWIMYFICKRKY